MYALNDDVRDFGFVCALPFGLAFLLPIGVLVELVSIITRLDTSSPRTVFVDDRFFLAGGVGSSESVPAGLQALRRVPLARVGTGSSSEASSALLGSIGGGSCFARNRAARAGALTEAGCFKF
jgi:hypothetical protein